MLHRHGNSSSFCAILISGIVNLLAATSKTRPFRSTTLLYDTQTVDFTDILMSRLSNYPVYVYNYNFKNTASKVFLGTHKQPPVLNVVPDRNIYIKKPARHFHRLPYHSMIHLIIISQPYITAIADIKDIAHIFDERNLILIVIDYQTMHRGHMKGIEMFLEDMWMRFKLSRIAVMFIYHKGKEDYRLEVRTYNPYLQWHQCHSWIWDDSTSSFRGDTNWNIVFYDRTRNLYGSSLRVSIIVDFSSVYNISGPGHFQNSYRLAGSGVFEMQTFANCLNASLEMIMPNFESVDGKNFVSENFLQFIRKRSVPIPVQESIWKRFSRQSVSSQYFQRHHDVDLVAMLSFPNLHSRIVLYPLHLFEIVALVPNVYQYPEESETFLFSVILSPMHAWYIVAVLLAILKKAFRCVIHQTGDSRLSTLSVDNMGILMASSSGMRLHSEAERVLRFFMSLSAFVMGLVITTFAYRSYYMNSMPLPLVDTLEDIIRSNLSIWISKDDRYVLGEDILVAELMRVNSTRKRIYATNDTNLVTIALRSSNTDQNAFLTDKTTAESILAMMRMNRSSKPPLRLMTNRIAQQLQAFWLPYPSSLETAINTMHLRYLEHGLQQYHESLNSRINYQYYITKQDQLTWLDRFTIVSLDSSIFTFQSSGIMLMISFVVFLLEVAVYRCYRN